MDILVYFGNCLGLKQLCLILNEISYIFYAMYFAVDCSPVKGVFVVRQRWLVTADRPEQILSLLDFWLQNPDLDLNPALLSRLKCRKGRCDSELIQY